MQTEKLAKIVKDYANELEDNAAQSGYSNDLGARHLRDVLFAYMDGLQDRVPKILEKIVSEYEIRESQEYQKYLELDKKYGKYKGL